jgi:hypothetical protein
MPSLPDQTVPFVVICSGPVQYELTQVHEGDCRYHLIVEVQQILARTENLREELHDLNDDEYATISLDQAWDTIRQK